MTGHERDYGSPDTLRTREPFRFKIIPSAQTNEITNFKAVRVLHFAINETLTERPQAGRIRAIDNGKKWSSLCEKAIIMV